MTLNEAIAHAEEIAKDCEVHCIRYPEQLAYEEKFYDAKTCAAEHRQLAEWLKDYKRLLEQPEVIRCKDCKHMNADGVCNEFADDRIRPYENDFCSCGERKRGKTI